VDVRKIGSPVETDRPGAGFGYGHDPVCAVALNRVEERDRVACADGEGSGRVATRVVEVDCVGLRRRGGVLHVAGEGDIAAMRVQDEIATVEINGAALSARHIAG